MAEFLTQEEIEKKVEEYRQELIEKNKPLHLTEEDRILVSVRYLDLRKNIITSANYYVDNVWSSLDALTEFFHKMNESKEKYVLIGYYLLKVDKRGAAIDLNISMNHYSPTAYVEDMRTKDDEEEIEEDDEDEN